MTEGQPDDTGGPVSREALIQLLEDLRGELHFRGVEREQRLMRRVEAMLGRLRGDREALSPD
ncbi:hypothetical protein [Ferrimonas balearica]|uniref:hypothetical protein n=1 Tax=Ferrimonas balearica TaxID=44012 RepID=UPI001C99D778|nr:hypothetical protein [Ferrimonas balearica]MBY5922280.1 hypothetical protein [Ferrimonas balearica]MBY5994380.1 hypothetical protein [Ferrimonas balearica]